MSLREVLGRSQHLRRVKMMADAVRNFDLGVAAAVMRGRHPEIEFEKLTSQISRVPVEKAFTPEYKAFIERGEIRSVPLTVNVEVTTKCQLACQMCDRVSLRDSEKGIATMSDEVFRRAAGEAARLGTALQLNRFGEPTLDKKLVERVRLAKDMGIKHVYFVTNGMLLDERLGCTLIEAGVDRIAISVDRATPDTFERIRRRGNYATVRKNVARFVCLKELMKAFHLRINLRVTILKENMHEILDIYRQWLGVVSDIVPCLGFSYKNLKIHDRIMTQGWDARVACPAILGRSVVNVDGSIVMCCVENLGELRVGHVMDRPLEDCYDGPEARRIRELHRRKEFKNIPVCDQCDFTYEGIFLSEQLARAIDRRARKIVQTERLLGRNSKVDIMSEAGIGCDPWNPRDLMAPSHSAK